MIVIDKILESTKNRFKIEHAINNINTFFKAINVKKIKPHISQS